MTTLFDVLKALLFFSLAVIEVSAATREPAYFAPKGSQFDAPDFGACGPASEFNRDVIDTFAKIGQVSSARGPSNTDGLDVEFCSRWNPDFPFNGHHCCSKSVVRRRKVRTRCPPERRRGTFCQEKTEEQELYAQSVLSGEIPDVLAFLTQELGRNATQSYCSVNNGFLVRGKPVIPSDVNGIVLRNPQRCAEYGVDSMVAMTEWLGREVKKRYTEMGPEYAGVKLVLGDVTGPRGGCVGHASHRTGLDADIGFIAARPNRPSTIAFHRDFQVEPGAWFIKKVFRNPFACVRVIFLDRKLIAKLNKHFGADPEWAEYRKFVRHMPRHKDHFHIRVGEYPGLPGCVSDARPEDEEEEDGGEDESDPSDSNDVSSDLPGESSDTSATP